MNSLPPRRDLPGRETRRHHLMNEISTHRRRSKRRFVIGGAVTAGLAAGVAGVLLLNTADPAVNPKLPVGPATLVPYKLVASEVLLKASNAAAAAPDLQ